MRPALEQQLRLWPFGRAVQLPALPVRRPLWDKSQVSSSYPSPYIGFWRLSGLVFSITYLRIRDLLVQRGCLRLLHLRVKTQFRAFALRIFLHRWCSLGAVAGPTRFRVAVRDPVGVELVAHAKVHLLAFRHLLNVPKHAFNLFHSLL